MRVEGLRSKADGLRSKAIGHRHQPSAISHRHQPSPTAIDPTITINE
ncbi:MAG: hypothetical protein IKK62_06625 [Bacteroidaceae bacterium]|nr:hypothetical protein [Bacteroidaceae bacterium]